MQKVELRRKTKETDVKIKLNICGSGIYKINTEIHLLNHMLSLFSKHSLFDLEIHAKGDTKIDYHHLVEDIGITLGEALNKALQDKKKIKRYGFYFLPMDESLVGVFIDLGGRPYFSSNLKLRKKKVGNFDTELIEEFFKSFSNSGKFNLHIQQISGKNTHHLIEASFKALGKAFDEATKIDKRIKGVPSTKGVL